MPAHKKNLFLGVFLTVISFFFLTVNSVLVKLINNRVSPAQIMLFQSILCTVMFFCISMIKERSFSFFRSHHYLLLFYRALAGILTFFLIYVSLEFVSVTNVTLLFNTAPFFTPLLLYVLFKDRIEHHLWIGMVIGFLGIIFILHPGADIFNWRDILPLLSGVTGAAIFVSLGRLHHYREPTLRILFYTFLFGTMLVLPFGIYQWKTPSLKDLGLLISVAAAVFLAQTTVTLGFRFASPRVLAPLCYSSVVFAVFFDWLIWQEVPNWQAWIGMILVIVGGIVALIIESSKKDNGLA